VGGSRQDVILLFVDERFPRGGSEIFPAQGACGTAGLPYGG
jgi:hypothetical protein